MSELPTICPLDRLPREGETIFQRVTKNSKADYKVDANGCWVWQKYLLNGYAMGSGGRMARVYYERANGPIPDGHDVHHLCRKPACINPAHLQALEARTHRQGHQSPLTLEQIEEIRELGKVPGVSARQVARLYGTTHQSVYNWWNAARRRPDFDGEVQPEGWPCAREGCTELVTGNRHKRFCEPRCRSRQNREDRGIKPTPSRWQETR